jgi:hypothetical protein
MTSTRELLAQNRNDQYRSYVVRLLRPDAQHAWRIAVEVVSTRQQANLKDAAALAEFFNTQMALADQPADEPAD